MRRIDDCYHTPRILCRPCTLEAVAEIATQYDEPVGFRVVERVRTVEEIPMSEFMGIFMESVAESNVSAILLMHGGMIVQRGDRFIRSIGNWPLTTATIYVVGECDMTDGEILDKWRDQG